MNKRLQTVNQLTSALRLKQLNYNELFSDGLTPLESIEIYLKEQLRLREERATELRIKRSSLPARKTIGEFDFGF